jgi:FMN phosphatase YigB (HAD superfamily)
MICHSLQRLFMPIKAVIFDMDGVLSEVYWAEARIEYARDLGQVWGGDDHRRVMQERLRLEKSPQTIANDRTCGGETLSRRSGIGFAYNAY